MKPPKTALNELFTWGRTGATTIGDDSKTTVGGDKIFASEWGGMSEVYGSEWEETKVFEPARKIVGSAYNRNQEKCASEDDLTKLETIFKWARLDQLLGHAEVPLEQLFECEHFTVSFESTMTDMFKGERGAATGKWANDYTAIVEVKPKVEDTSTFPLLGEATGKYTETSGKAETTFTSNNKQCTNEAIEESGTGVPFNVTAMTVPNGLGAAAGGSGMTLTFTPGMPHENVLTTATPPECDPFPVEVPMYSWWTDWTDQHKSEVVSQESFEYKSTLTPGSGSETGSIEFNDVPFEKENADGKEDTTIHVMHKPGKFSKL